MRNYVIKRLLLFLPTILGVTVVLFVILRVVPGDVAAAILMGRDREANFTEQQRKELADELGLDRPIYVQYLDWMWGVARFNLGSSWRNNQPISRLLKDQFPVTMQLALFASVLIALFSIPIGVLSAVYQDRWPDYILRSIAILGLSIPTFALALMVVLGLSVGFHWLPPLGFVSLWYKPLTAVQQLGIPAAVLAFSGSGAILRLTRAQMLEVLRDDYIRTARAKGLAERTVIFRHALRNALLPVVTAFGFTVTFLFGGTLVVELIFSVPGIGLQLVNSIFTKDLTVVQAYVAYLAIVSMVVNLLVDMSYAWLDPRIQYA